MRGGGALPDGTPVIVSGGFDGRVRVWRLADGTPVWGAAYAAVRGDTGPVFAVAVGALPYDTPVIVSGGGDLYDGTVRVRRLANGTPVGEPLRGHTDLVIAVAAGALPDGTPVIVSGGSDSTVRVRRLADGTPVGERRCMATPTWSTRWRPGRCRTAPRSSSAAAATARCGWAAWPTAPRSASRCVATPACRAAAAWT